MASSQSYGSMPEPKAQDAGVKIAETEITIEWNRITIGTVKAGIYLGEEAHIRSEDADERFLIAEGDFEGVHYQVQCCYGGIEGAKKALKEEIESYLKKTC